MSHSQETGLLSEQEKNETKETQKAPHKQKVGVSPLSEKSDKKNTKVKKKEEEK